MSSTCTDTSNDAYTIFWFNYFVSIGYIDSDSVNLYAPYGKCTNSLLWITYLINVVHFFLLSSGVLYLLSFYRNKSGLGWPFITWISSFIFLIVAIIFFILRNLHTTLFSILIIGFQLAALIVLSISIFIVLMFTFAIERRYQRCLFFFIIILLLIQIGCFIGQALITLHCQYNLKFTSISLDYSYLSAIIAAVGAIVSTLLLDHIFVWYLNQKGSPRVAPAPVNQSNNTHDRTTSPLDPVIIDYFHRQPKAPLFHIYSNSDQTRHFHIHPTKPQTVGKRPDVIQLRNIGSKRKIQNSLTSSDA